MLTQKGAIILTTFHVNPYTSLCRTPSGDKELCGYHGITEGSGNEVQTSHLRSHKAIYAVMKQPGATSREREFMSKLSYGQTF